MQWDKGLKRGLPELKLPVDLLQVCLEIITVISDVLETVQK